MPVLIQLADSGIFKEIDSSSQKASAKHALKTGLESIVKSKTTEHVFWNPKLLEALENLGETDLKRIKREGTKATKGQEDVRQEKRKGDAIQLNEIPSAKKTKLDTSTSPQQQRTLYPRTDQVQLEQILILLAGLATSREYGKIHTFIDNMSPAVLTDVVIHNMRYLTTNLAEAVASGITTESMSTNPLSQLVAAQNVEEVQEDAVQMEEDAEAEAVASDAGALALGKELPSAFVVEPPELLHTPDSVSHLNTEDVAALGRAAVSRILGAQFREKRFEFLKHGILIDLALDEDVGGEGNAQVVLEYALGDWHGRDGHELLVRWLNALFLRFCGNDLKNDAHNLGGKDRLFAVKYDAILSAACEGLRERLSPKDKALSQLLMEVPWITKNAVDVVADICQLDKQNAGVWSVLGLTVLRDLILARPTVRDDALNYVLEFTADLDPAMRSRAIRLTVNILYPLDFLREKIEMFADTLLRTAELKEELMSDSIKQEEMDEDDADWERDEEVPGLELGATKKPKLAELLESRISLFMALCTKKHDLLSRLAESYARVDSFRQEIIGKNVPGLVRTIGQDVDVFLNLLDKLPESGEGFAVRCLYSLCEVGPIAAPLKDAVMRFYEKRGDPQLLPPACSSMSSSEFLQVLPAIVRDLDPIAVANALIIAMGGRPIISLDALGDVTIDSARSCIDPPEILIFLHVLDLEKHDVPLKKVVEACNYCFGLKGVFKPELLAIAIQRLSDETVLPVLLMRTVIQTLSVAPSLKKFIVSDVLPKLVNKRVWTVPQLWQGFIRCCQQTMPESYPALLQLPTPQLQEVLDLSAGLKEALAGYAKKSRLALSSAHRELLGLSR